jgi:hypothetical protein
MDDCVLRRVDRRAALAFLNQDNKAGEENKGKEKDGPDKAAILLLYRGSR